MKCDKGFNKDLQCTMSGMVYLERRLKGGERITVGGAEYVMGGSALAKELGVPYTRIAKFYGKGLPRIETNFKKLYLFPLEDCRNWIQEHTKQTQLTLDGRLYYCKAKIAELLNVAESTVQDWKDNSEIPFIPWYGGALYPVEECLEWRRERLRLQERRGRIGKGGREQQSKCNFCDNAYAHKCCWFRDYTPVEGWKADRTAFSGSVYDFTYNVLDCPNFKPDPPRNAPYW